MNGIHQPPMVIPPTTYHRGIQLAAQADEAFPITLLSARRCPPGQMGWVWKPRELLSIPTGRDEPFRRRKSNGM